MYAGFYPQSDLVDQSFGLRKAIAHSQLYEKDEEYIKTDMLRDTYDIAFKAHRERKLLSPYSPLGRQQSAKEQNDDTQVQSLTGTNPREKRATRVKPNEDKTGKPSWWVHARAFLVCNKHSYSMIPIEIHQWLRQRSAASEMHVIRG